MLKKVSDVANSILGKHSSNCKEYTFRGSHGTYPGIGFNTWATKAAGDVTEDLTANGSSFSSLRIIIDDKAYSDGKCVPRKITSDTSVDELDEIWSRSHINNVLLGPKGFISRLPENIIIYITFNPPPLGLLTSNCLSGDENIRKASEWVVSGLYTLSKHALYERIKYVEIFNEPSADPKWGYYIAPIDNAHLVQYIIQISESRNLALKTIVGPGTHIASANLFGVYYHQLNELKNKDCVVEPSIHAYEKNKTFEGHEKFSEDLEAIQKRARDRFHVTELGSHAPINLNKGQRRYSHPLAACLITDNIIDVIGMSPVSIILWMLMDSDWDQKRFGYFTKEGKPKDIKKIVDFFMKPEINSSVYCAKAVKSEPNNRYKRARMVLFIKKSDSSSCSKAYIIISNARSSDMSLNLNAGSNIIGNSLKSANLSHLDSYLPPRPSVEEIKVNVTDDGLSIKMNLPKTNICLLEIELNYGNIE